jgi:hypothetical protein
VNEAEYLAAEDPIPLLAWFLDQRRGEVVPQDPGNMAVSDRKLRLFAAACTLLLPRRTPGLRRAVGAALAFADGEIGGYKMDVARWEPSPGPWTVCNPDAGEAAYYVIRDDSLTDRRAEMAALLRDVFGNPFRPVELRHLGNALCRRCNGAGTRPDVYPPAPCPACSCVTPVALSVARRAYECRDFAALPILADALEEAGCEDGPLLWHLRGKERCRACGKEHMVWSDDGGTDLVHCPVCCGTGWRSLSGLHVRGCWALDLILGKS